LSSKEQDKLINFIKGVAGDEHLKIEEDLGNGFVRLRVSEAERRQAKHDIRFAEDVVVELIRNSRDAGCRNIFVAFHKDKDIRNIVIIDDGSGIPSNLMPRIFEPRVTSKLETVVTDKYGIHGRGMALYSIKSNVEDVDIVASAVDRGSVIRVRVNTGKLPERHDQSTFPATKMHRGEINVVKGPHNILRLLTEFCIEHPELKIFFGSPAQILATMYDLSQNLLTSNKGGKAVFLENFEEGVLPLWQCTGFIADVKALMEISKTYYGLDVSQRNVHRIFSGEIESLDDLHSILISKHKNSVTKRVSGVDLSCSTNLVKYIQKDDLDILSKGIEKEFNKIGNKYFLHLKGDPKIWREKNKIKILLEVEGEDDF